MPSVGATLFLITGSEHTLSKHFQLTHSFLLITTHFKLFKTQFNFKMNYQIISPPLASTSLCIFRHFAPLIQSTLSHTLHLRKYPGRQTVELQMRRNFALLPKSQFCMVFHTFPNQSGCQPTITPPALRCIVLPSIPRQIRPPSLCTFYSAVSASCVFSSWVS